MTSSVSFDRAAGFYDETRAFPPAISDHVMWAIVSLTQATRATRMVEIGIGTGRIAVPLLAWGQRVTGVDLSPAMMARLRAKLTSGVPVALLQGDATALPLVDAATDVVIMVHVLHLVPGWRQALAETRRILVPGGWLLHSYSRRDPDLPTSRVREHWRSWVAAESPGVQLIPGAQSEAQVRADLEASGAQVQVVEIAAWTAHPSLAGLIDALATRTFSDTWPLSDDLLARSVADLRAWAAAEYGALHELREEPRSMQFQVARWVQRAGPLA